MNGALQEALNVQTMEGLARFVLTVLKLTLAFELTGALILTARWAGEYGIAQAAYYGVFHAISAFNNAGFPEREMAIWVAHSLVMPNVIDYIELSRDFSIVEVPAPDAFVGRTLKTTGTATAARSYAYRNQASAGRRWRNRHEHRPSRG